MVQLLFQIRHKLTAASITHNNGGSITISDGEIECTGKADIDGLLTISGSGATLMLTEN